ncbi:hypothetical protein PVAP13_5KG017300 [Panicum virgatum]|uniref:Late embryogenesis abundant protein LEA-2 subgroup domain-containing protein n=1 Tax=Panicum virgatum TaxID=38727 RepID=A0A8T0SD07_PANVG|nr:hypothetical protein PVAP13_5KG017300 [Panicum virgatum]
MGNSRTVRDLIALIEKPEAELADISVGHLLAQERGRGRWCRGPYPTRAHSPPGGTTRLDVPVKVPYDFLVSLVKDAGRDRDIDYEMRVGLTVDLPILSNFTLPLTKSGELKLPTLSTIF